MSLPSPENHWALFLDFDGTLVDIADHPDAVEPHDHLLDVLRHATTALDGALAVVSGRSLAQLDHFLAPLTLPGAGLHGLELRLPDGAIRRDDSARAAVDRARRVLTARIAGRAGLLLEDKGLTRVLHFRASPQLADECRAAAEAGLAAGGDGLILLPGKMIFELKPAGVDKGQAIRRLLDHAPFRGRTPVFVGDDVTDEAGFEAVNRLGGHSIRVGDGQATVARHRAADVETILDWLARFPGPQPENRHQEVPQ